MMRFRSQHRLRDTELRAPFVLERRFEDVRQGGYFRPTAALWITSALRESGLLRDLAPEDLRLLLAVLSSVNGNGAFIATPELLAPALGLSNGATRSRLERLQSVVWSGELLLTSHTSESGLHFIQPSPHLLEERHSVISPAPAHGGRIEPPELAFSSDAPLAPVSASGSVSRSIRKEVVAHSRATYTRPRAEVEAEINRFLSHDWRNAYAEPGGIEAEEEAALPDTPEARERLRLKRALIGLGVPPYRAEALLENHAADRIARQLEWLPYRQARSPAGYVVAAIEKGYAPPPAVSLQQAIEQQAIEQQEVEATVSAEATVASDVSDVSQREEQVAEESGRIGIEIQGIDSLSYGAGGEAVRKEADETP